MSQLVAGCLGDCAVFDAGIPAGVRGRVGWRCQERHSLRFERPAMNARMSSTASRLLAICFFAGCCSAAELSATFGSYKRYLDEPNSATYGGSIRIPLARRWSVRPEVLVDNGKNFSNVLALGSVMFDFTDPDKRAVGYAVFSAGTVQTLDQRISFSASHWLGAGGAGVRFALSEHWIAAAEMRVGMPAFPLITFNLGYRWGRR